MCSYIEKTIHSRQQHICFLWISNSVNSETIHEMPNTHCYLQVVNEKSPEVATPSKQHVAVGFEDAALHQDAAVTEEVSLALLVELK